MTDALTPLVPDEADEIEPGVVRVLCDNPGMMTGPGTNTYLIGHDELAVIDPGPDHEAHLDAVARLGGDRIRWILCTHTHLDHSPGAAGLAARTGAAILSFAMSTASSATSTSLTATPSRSTGSASRRCTHPDTPPTISASGSSPRVCSSPAIT